MRIFPTQRRRLAELAGDPPPRFRKRGDAKFGAQWQTLLCYIAEDRKPGQ